jgi:hypothetical protein
MTARRGGADVATDPASRSISRTSNPPKGR